MKKKTRKITFIRHGNPLAEHPYALLRLVNAEHIVERPPVGLKLAYYRAGDMVPAAVVDNLCADKDTEVTIIGPRE